MVGRCCGETLEKSVPTASTLESSDFRGPKPIFCGRAGLLLLLNLIRLDDSELDDRIRSLPDLLPAIEAVVDVAQDKLLSE